jgi:hypothetical protein
VQQKSPVSNHSRAVKRFFIIPLFADAGLREVRTAVSHAATSKEQGVLFDFLSIPCGFVAWVCLLSATGLGQFLIHPHPSPSSHPINAEKTRTKGNHTNEPASPSSKQRRKRNHPPIQCANHELLYAYTLRKRARLYSFLSLFSSLCTSPIPT